jgi:hypothetical protein
VYLRCASLPGNVQLLGQCNSSIIVRQFTGQIRASSSESNTIVDAVKKVSKILFALPGVSFLLQDTGVTARTPDGRSGRNLIILGIDIASKPISTGDDSLCSRGLGSILGEEISRVEVARHSFVEASIAVVGGIQDGVLEASWVLKAQMELAILGVIRCSGARTDVCLETIESESENLIRELTVCTHEHVYWVV